MKLKVRSILIEAQRKENPEDSEFFSLEIPEGLNVYVEQNG